MTWRTIDPALIYDLPALDDLVGRPAWMKDGLCREPTYRDVDFFASGRGEVEMVKQAKQVCSHCLVLKECRDYAMADPGLLGVWGGTTERERRRLRAAARKVA